MNGKFKKCLKTQNILTFWLPLLLFLTSLFFLSYGISGFFLKRIRYLFNNFTCTGLLLLFASIIAWLTIKYTLAGRLKPRHIFQIALPAAFFLLGLVLLAGSAVNYFQNYKPYIVNQYISWGLFLTIVSIIALLSLNLKFEGLFGLRNIFSIWLPAIPILVGITIFIYGFATNVKLGHFDISEYVFFACILIVPSTYIALYLRNLFALIKPTPNQKRIPALIMFALLNLALFASIIWLISFISRGFH